MRTLLPALITLFMSGVLLASETDKKSAPAAAPTWDRYEVLIKRNIFSKDRGRARETRVVDTSKEKETPPPPKPEGDIALIGIVQKDGQLVAFLENSKTGLVQTVSSGDSVARGKISAITLNGIEYAVEGVSTPVAIGKTLDGGAITRSSESVKSASTPGSTGSSETDSILERMRKKRLEALSR